MNIVSIGKGNYGSKLVLQRVPVEDPYRSSSTWEIEMCVETEPNRTGVSLNRPELAALAAAIEQYLKDTQGGK